MRRDQSGQALVLCLVVGTVLLAGFGILAGFGQALGGKARHQRGADLAAVSAAYRHAGADYPRLFEAALLEPAACPIHDICPRRSTWSGRAQQPCGAGRREPCLAYALRDVSFPGAGVPAHTRLRPGYQKTMSRSCVAGPAWGRHIAP